MRLQIVTAGELQVDGDGVLHADGWKALEPGVDPHLPVEWVAPSGFNGLFGYSVKELHEMSHGQSCCCPVLGFEVSNGTTIYAYDEPVPYDPAVTAAARQQGV